MPDNPKKLSQFWQELKRRKVVRVITVYAAAAFVILELVSIIVEPLKLPEWTLPLIIVLLCVGFIIAVILSWIYDIHPEGGIVKTESAHKVKEEDIPKSSNSWKIASYISFIVIVSLIVLNILPRISRSGDDTILDKSIAVLPFISLSDDPEKQYLADGVMDAILLHLSKIKDLRVMARTSVEQYRESEKTVTSICEELNVSYVLEGSFQKYGDHARLIVQLIQPGMEGHVWANEYDREWKDIFSVQSEIAQKVAGELEAVISPVEKQRIERIPTSSLTAYDFQQMGQAELYKKILEYDQEALERAEVLFFKALEYDSTFAEVYAGLAGIHANKAGDLPSASVEVEYYDSCFQLLDIALSYDDELPAAYMLKGIFYFNTGQPELGFAAFDKALEFDPNYLEAYFQKGVWHMNYKYDMVQCIQNYYKATRLHRGPWLPQGLRNVVNALYWAGFPQQGTRFLQEALELDGDSAKFFYNLAHTEHYHGNYQNANALWRKSYLADTGNLSGLSRLGENYLFQEQFEKSLEYFLQYLEKTNEPDWIQIHHIGYAFLINGLENDAEHYLNMQIENCKRLNETGTSMAAVCHWTYHWLAASYAALGETEIAIENLKLSTQKDKFPIWMVNDLKNDPIYDQVRDEPEFQQIVRDVEAKYQAEHERVRQWLEENDML